MKTTSTRWPAICGILLLGALLVVTVTGAGDSDASWTRWGGPNQDFRAASNELAETWPEAGPKRLWSRELGDGYSAILAESGRLYTMYRSDKNEVVVSLDASSGETLWEHSYESLPNEGHVTQFGEGPRSTPLIDGDRLYTIGISGVMHALSKADGKVLWKHDLWSGLGGNFLNHGYSSSPIAYKNTIIALVGGENASLVAFDKKNGEIVWSALSFENSYSTPRIFRIGGKDQLIAFMAKEMIGVDPRSGKLLWSYPHENQWGQNIHMPAMAGDVLFISSLQAGSKGLRLRPKGGETRIEEVWSTRKIQFYHSTTVQDGDYVYGTTGTTPAFMAAVNIRNGEIGWRKRGFAKANTMYADGRLIVLDEDGKLYLVSADPEEMTIHSEVQLLEKVAWTVPTVVGRTMFVRDKVHIMALDLG